MTQAINLANFANNLDTSGGVNPSVLNAPVPVSKGGTSGTTAATARANLDVAQAIYSVPSGGIIMWSGSIASIPGGWFLCNGGNGTPNLLDRFVIAAGSGYGVGSTGGTTDSIVVSHTHTASLSGTSSGQSANHTHAGVAVQVGGPFGSTDRSDFSFTNTPANSNDHTHTITVTGATNSSGGSGSNANMPPYYALAYIMKS
jgi:hypothetical protein